MSLKISIVLAIFLNLNTWSGVCQTHYIGMHSDEIKRVMQEEQKKLNLDNTTVNRAFSYLKYVDVLGEQTLLYFLDENDYCTWWKLMVDYSLLEDRKNWLNKTFKKKSENSWSYEYDGEVVELTLKEEDWYFSISAKLSEQE